MQRGAFWIPIGAGFGVAIGVALDNLALWIAVGAGFGVMMMAVQGLGSRQDDE